MRTANIRAAVNATPFEPFTLYLADGRNAYVPGPDFVAFSPQGMTVIVWTDDDGARTIDVALVTEIRPGPPGAPAEAA